MESLTPLPLPHPTTITNVFALRQPFKAASKLEQHRAIHIHQILARAANLTKQNPCQLLRSVSGVRTYRNYLSEYGLGFRRLSCSILRSFFPLHRNRIGVDLRPS